MFISIDDFTDPQVSFCIKYFVFMSYEIFMQHSNVPASRAANHDFSYASVGIWLICMVRL